MVLELFYRHSLIIHGARGPTYLIFIIKWSNKSLNLSYLRKSTHLGDTLLRFLLQLVLNLIIFELYLDIFNCLNSISLGRFILLIRLLRLQYSFRKVSNPRAGFRPMIFIFVFCLNK